MGEADSKSSDRILIGLGVGIITAVSGLSVAGTYTAINAMNRQSEEAIQAAKDAQNAANQNDSSNTPGTSQTPSDGGNTQTPGNTGNDGWNSDQLKWMQENHITYDKYGIPMDENGNYVDDPTTPEYDPDRAAYFYGTGDNQKPDVEPGTQTPGQNPGGTTDSSDPDLGGSGSGTVAQPGVEDMPDDPTPQNPVVNPGVDPVETTPAASAWWFDENGNLLPGLSLDENGKPYYVVQKGDWLSRIASRYGFEYPDLARESGIANPDLIYEGDIIRFPESGPKGWSSNVTDGQMAPGRG